MTGTSTLPKYRQISRAIIDRIRDGDLAPGERVPSENDIITQWGVSNTTARKALADVEQAGWVRRIKARGTYVRPNPVGRSLNRILGFSHNMREAGRTPSTRVLDIHTRKQGLSMEITGRRYRLPGPICVIERLRLADGVPMMRETRYIATALCPDIATKNLAGSLYDLYDREYGLRLTDVRQMLGVTILDNAADCDLFELDAPVPALLVEGATFCGPETILEMERSLYRGDHYQFSVTATPNDDRATPTPPPTSPPTPSS